MSNWLSVLFTILIFVCLGIAFPVGNKITFVATAIVIIVLFVIYEYWFNTQEHFDVLLGDPANNRINALDLENFFQFVDYFQANDLDPEDRPLNATCNLEGDIVKIRNSINEITRMLHFIVQANDKDNFYSRWLVAKMGSNMEWDEAHPRRRLNYDEMVENNIGTQFTIVPKNQLDLYAPNANLNSKNQNPMPFSINVRNYYNGQDVEVNLLTLKSLLELVQENNPEVFADIVRPSEHSAFQQEFVAPLKTIIHNMVNIAMTDTFKDYLTKQKFDVKYGTMTFNPLMITNQFGTF